jgi:SAM-dependent methyltransferase
MKPPGDNVPTHTGRPDGNVDPAFWAGRYQAGETGWDHGEASPGLVDFLHTQVGVVREPPLRPGTILVPGCGRGHDARALAKAGFEVTAIDVVQRAIDDARRLAIADAGARHAAPLRFEIADFFKLPPALRGPYDWLFEHTFFCAIDPAMRGLYMETVAGLVKPGGRLLGIFYNIQPETGPPFGTTREELLQRFTPAFSLQYECVPRSYESRKEKELLMVWQRKADWRGNGGLEEKIRIKD